MIVAGASVQGTAHLAAGQGCQDAFKAIDLGDTAVLAVSDGASSRDRSALGAHIAVDAACRLLTEDIPDAGESPEAWTRRIAGRGQRVVEEYLRAVFGVLGTEPGSADSGAADPGALAATLTAAVVAPPWVAFVSIGDGFGTLLTRDDRCHLVLPPPTGPPVFLSSPGAALRLRTFVVWEPELGGVVLATDGCAALTLDHPSVRQLGPEVGPLPTERFFLGLAATLRQNHGDAEPLRHRLSGPEAGRTGDDLTVLCALVEGG
ncbi:protein phosphatase 2C domain-containing protein [Streptomyces sp. NBS 14/10]|uniref:protein phosphatase 2C domain-containing protein n=1 Tax=Streptomyces sp. NBS 14/10 TaxID=1945643 RepID=UPI000B7C8114|nr:protein phosphatase 2C domain-containing protein [Streptomyces sp. NBS 14/10]KAK1185588.1 protein phosphatase 2C domain-containing protein [Streptomyces sp. NBS 14/10]